MAGLQFPNGHRFAFTILDDTDDTTLATGVPVYALLHNLGLKITKTVWALDTDADNKGPYFAGETLATPGYLDWVRQLAEQGFEIAFHNATMGSSPRADTIAALDLIEQELGEAVRLHCNHGQNLENLHWGADRYCLAVTRALLGLRGGQVYLGHRSDSPYYWADVADQRITYMRSFAYNRLDCQGLPPGKPYLDSSKQQRCAFFSTADACDVEAFNRLVNRASIDRLAEAGGWSIVSTHLGKGFFDGNEVNPQFAETMSYLAKQGGWYVPVSELLDFLVEQYGLGELTLWQKAQIDIAHIADRVMGRLMA